MTTILRPLGLALLLAAANANAADAAFYFINIGANGNAVLYSESASAPKGDVSYALVDRVSAGCCFRAAAGKPARQADDEADKFMADSGKPVFSHAVRFGGARKPEPGLAYGVEGMRAVTKTGRDTYRVTLQAGDPVFVRTCFTSEGMQVRLFRAPADRKPYASYYYSLGYDVEPTCR